MKNSVSRNIFGEKCAFKLRAISYLILSLFVIYLLFTKRQVLDFSKFKEFTDDNSKCDENGSKLFKRVENTMGKGEIARYEQFLLFPRCFQKTCYADL